jgi:1-acyl-sn-glycerol-3-phosphate acyltransferase
MPDRTALRGALDVLAGGGVLGMFPEGTRGEGRLETVQHGIGYLALRAGCPIVPVVCVGTAQALPRGRKMPKLGTRVDIVFGPAFTLDVDGNPRARSTVATAAEQIRLHLLRHLQSVSDRAA